jgi:hypothetical protein
MEPGIQPTPTIPLDDRKAQVNAEEDILPTTVSWKPRITAFGSKFDIVDVLEFDDRHKLQVHSQARERSKRASNDTFPR